MKSKTQFFRSLFLPIVLSIFVLAIIFLSATITWITLTDNNFNSFFEILRKVLAKSGSYSTLLAAFIATVFFQTYSSIKNEKTAIADKISNIGHYTLNFQSEDSTCKLEFKYHNFVVEIESEDDFGLRTPSSLISDTPKIDKYRYFYLAVKQKAGCQQKTIWVSALTDKGIHLLINMKISIENCDKRTETQILQQTIYFNHNNTLLSMYQ